MRCIPTHLKSTQTRVVGIITYEMTPYTFFIENPLLENKKYECISSVIVPTTHVYVHFKCVGMHLVCHYPYYPKATNICVRFICTNYASQMLVA